MQTYFNGNNFFRIATKQQSRIETIVLVGHQAKIRSCGVHSMIGIKKLCFILAFPNSEGVARSSPGLQN